MAIPKIFKKEEIQKESTTEPSKKPVLKKTPMAWSILKNPYISEKATSLAKENKYVFKISDNANKIQVKKAVEEIYGSKVVEVNIIKVPRKRKRLGKHHGWKKGFKKAIVQIKEGQKIDVYPG